MTRLLAEFKRLYMLCAEADARDPDLTRALGLELARPADWAQLAAVWRGVQTDLDLPAPGISVNGTDGMQLWFSLSEPVHRARGHAWLERLRDRYLGRGVAQHRVRLLSGVDPSAGLRVAGHAPWVPAQQAGSGNWSAFLAQDLAPIFEDTPWLDIPPGDEGQAQLLAGLASISPAQFIAAENLLGAGAAPPVAHGPDVPSGFAPAVTPQGATAGTPAALPAASRAGAPSATPVVSAAAGAQAAPLDPRGFLLSVMNDADQPMALRIEAAKALLPNWR